MIVAIDVFAAVVVLIGFHLAFRQKVVREMLGRPADNGVEAAGNPDDLASVFRIVGVMLMAFAVTICIFANLIVHYSAASAP